MQGIFQGGILSIDKLIKERTPPVLRIYSKLAYISVP